MDGQPTEKGTCESDAVEIHVSEEEEWDPLNKKELRARMENNQTPRILGGGDPGGATEEPDPSQDRVDEGDKRPGSPRNGPDRTELKDAGNGRQDSGRRGGGSSRVSVIRSPKERTATKGVPDPTESESPLSAAGDLSDDEVYAPADYFHIKEESLSSDGSDFPDDDLYEPAERAGVESVRVVEEPASRLSVRAKEEPDSYEKGDAGSDFITVYIKDEPDEPQGGSDLYTQSAYIMVDSEAPEENIKEGVIYAPTEYIFTRGYKKWAKGAGPSSKTLRLADDQRGSAGEVLFPCLECQKCFGTDLALIKHRVVHTTKELTCTQCGKRLSSKSSLVRHCRSHIGNDLFACPQCGKCFTYRANLVAHQRTHSGLKPFACSVCGNRYTVKTSLVRHQLIHEGVKPYSCSECGKSFSLNSTLLKHQMTHTGEKPFSCAECGKSFALKSLLARHQMLHTGEKPHACPDCGKRFVCKSDVSKHRKTHTGEKPHLCAVCGKGFTKRSNLRKHDLIHTRDKANRADTNNRATKKTCLSIV